MVVLSPELANQQGRPYVRSAGRVIQVEILPQFKHLEVGNGETNMDSPITYAPRAIKKYLYLEAQGPSQTLSR
jgi:hypothetical protein